MSHRVLYLRRVYVNVCIWHRFNCMMLAMTMLFLKLLRALPATLSLNLLESLYDFPSDFHSCP